MKNNDSQKNHNGDSTPKIEGSNLYERINRLSEKLSIISYHLSESNAAARASSIVKTCISLNAINFDVMNTVVKFIIEADACNIYPTTKETRLSQEFINETKQLADDLLADMPFDFQLVDDDKPPVDPVGTLDQKVGRIEDVIIIGTIRHIRKIITRNMDLMAKIKVLGNALENEVVVFPRTFAKYRDLLENQPVDIQRAFVCYLDDGQYFLKEIKGVDIPVPSAFEDLVDELFEDFPEEEYKEFIGNDSKQEKSETACYTVYFEVEIGITLDLMNPQDFDTEHEVEGYLNALPNDQMPYQYIVYQYSNSFDRAIGDSITDTRGDEWLELRAFTESKSVDEVFDDESFFEDESDD